MQRDRMKITNDSPSAGAVPGAALQSGYLSKLSGRAFLYPGSWKKKYCVLDSQRLFIFDTKEDEAACVTHPERISSYINLEYYDICDEASAKEVRKASNVFLIGCSDKSFFESGRHYFSAETLPEMNDWMSKIRAVMESLNSKRSQSAKQTAKKSDANQARSSNKTDDPSTKQENSINSAGDCVMPTLAEMTSEAEQLDCITRQRAKGPAGRRLPRQRFALTETSSPNVREQRSGSLSLLDVPDETEPKRTANLHNRSFDVSAVGEETYWSLPQPGMSVFKPVYAYSSSDESLNASFSSAITENEKLKKGDRPILTGKRSSATAKQAAGTVPDSTGPTHEPEAVETLCEEAKLHSSTPSLPLLQKQSWMSVGSSSTAPSVARQKRRGLPRNVVTLAQMEATWSRPSTALPSDAILDDPGNGAEAKSEAGEQLHAALEEIRELRTSLALLEGDSASARRDMGSLQENLTTVQSAAAAAAEKVAKMQNQVNNIERQVLSAVKEVQSLQQKANEALTAATSAERDFRRLEEQCRNVLSEFRQQQQQPRKACEEEIPETLAETPDAEYCSPCLTPLTPNFSIGSVVSNVVGASSSRISFMEPDQNSRPLPLSNAILKMQPPTSFDFASLLSAKSNSAVQETPKIKSALKSDGKASAKSISFGPTTTFQDPSSPLLVPDLSNPFATSTLRKTSTAASVSQN